MYSKEKKTHNCLNSLKWKTKLIYHPISPKRNPYQSLWFFLPPDCDGKNKQLKQNQQVFLSLLRVGLREIEEH